MRELGWLRWFSLALHELVLAVRDKSTNNVGVSEIGNGESSQAGQDHRSTMPVRPDGRQSAESGLGHIGRLRHDRRPIPRQRAAAAIAQRRR